MYTHFIEWAILNCLLFSLRIAPNLNSIPSHTEQTFKNEAPFILLLLFSPPLCSSDTNTVFKGQCIQTTHYSLFTQCKFLSQDLKDELSLAVTFPSQILVDVFGVIYNYASYLFLQVPHNRAALHFRILNAYTLVDDLQSRHAPMDMFCFLEMMPR